MRRALFLGLWLMLFLLRFDYLQGQNYTMTNGRVTTCSGNFYDPGGPDENYGDNLDFTQTFTAASPNMCLKVTFTSFHLEGAYYEYPYYYLYDALYIYDGPSEDSPLIGIYFGSNSPGVVTSTSGSLTFVFFSDESYNYSGWEATISCVECPEPENNMHDGTVIVDCSKSIVPFYDPGGPSGDYGNFSYFTQTFVSSDPDSCLEVTFDTIDLETRWDALYVYDGTSDTTGTLLRAFSSSYSNVTLTSFTGALTFKFTSDYDDQRAGWEASIRCSSCAESPPSPPPPPAPNPCEPNGIHPFCTDANPYGIIYTSGTSGNASSFLHSSSYSCLSTMPNPAWYYMQISDPGDLLIYIEQTTLSGDGLDVDFVCWGPFTASSQSDFVDKLCSGSYTLNDSIGDYFMGHRPENGNHQNDMGGYPVGNVVDCSYSIAATEWCFIPNAQPGEWYLLLITNYRGYSGQITFGLVEEYSTASTNCSLLAPISYNAPLCEGDTLVLTCENPQEGATYHWSGPGGWNEVTTVPFVAIPNATISQSGQYVLYITDVSSTADTSRVDVTIRANPSVTITASEDTICSGNAVTLQAAGADTYRWLSTPSVASSLTVTPDSTTTYRVVGQTGVCVDTADFRVTVFQSTVGDTFAVACDRFDWYEHENITENGEYFHTFTNAAGCDSMVTLHLTIGNTPETIIEAKACEFYEWYDSIYTQSGNYHRQFRNVYGCDSTLTLHLIIGHEPEVTITLSSDTVCQGSTVTLTAEVENSDSQDFSYLWNTGATTNSITVRMEETTQFTVTVTDSADCSGSATREVQIFESEPIMNVVYRCSDSSAVLTAREAVSYEWEMGDTTQSVTVPASGLYLVSVTPFDGCPVVDSFKVVTMLVNAFSDIRIPEMCGGGSYQVTVSHDSIADMVIRTHETSLALHDTMFIPGGDTCETNDCHHRSLLQLGIYEDTAHVNSVDDIRYVRVNMEHSYVGDLYIKLTCPNGQSADILRYGNPLQYEDRGDCWNEIPLSCFEWQTGDTNANLSTYFGLPIDRINSEYPCDSTDSDNAPGVGWNYCWSNNMSEGYTYAGGVGSLVYRNENVIIPADIYLFHYVFDSTHVTAGTQFYHPDESFESLVGCPLNGTWTLEVMDGNTRDNGYIFGWELALSEDFPTFEYVDVDYITVDGPWVEVTDSIFLFSPPVDLERDTTVSYTFHSFSEQGCHYDTTVEITFNARNINTINESVCDSLVWNGVIYTKDTTITVTLTNIHGCDSIVTLNVTVNDTTHGFKRISILENELPDFSLNGYTYDSAGTYTQILTNMAGCDSLLTIELVVLYNVDAQKDSSVCDNAFPFFWNGVRFDEPGSQTVILEASSGADSILLMNVEALPHPTATISGMPVICNGDPALLTANEAFAYQWSNGDTTRSVAATTTGRWRLTVTDVNGCQDTTSVKVIATEMYKIDSIVLPRICAGDDYIFTVGHQSTSNIIIGNNETSLARTETIFLPDGVDCPPYGCSYVSPLTFSAFPDDATVTSVNDILYVRLNMEHSYAADLYINIRCPNEQKADILRFNGSANSDCSSTIPYSSRSWQPGSNARNYTYFGWPYDNESDFSPCDADNPANAPGTGWNYCWSNNDAYSYGGGNGSLIYRSNNVRNYGNYFWPIYVFDSSNVALGTQFYHPDQSFSNLIGCPLNGTWKIEVMDGYEEDNGYVFGWELALSPHITTIENTDVTHVTVEGEWIEPLNDTTFLISPPATLTRDTTVQFLYHLFDDYGCSYDTLLSVMIFATDTVVMDTVVCDSFTWNNVTYTESGPYSQQFTNIHGCDSIVTINLTVVSSPQVTITGPVLLCADSVATLSAGDYAHYVWSTGDTTRTIDIGGSGTYSVTVTDEHGCGGRDSLQVTSPVYPIVSVSRIGICADSTCGITMGLSAENTVTLNQDPNLFAMDVQGIWIYDDEEGVPTVIPPANFPKDTTIRVAFSLADTNGCQYDTTLIVDVYHLIYKTIDSTVCDSLVFDGITYTQSGVSQHNFRTVNGCDSIVMLNLTVNYSAETYDTLYLVHNQLPYYFEPADIYFITPDDMSFQYLLQTQGGCDSVIQQQVYIYSNIVEEKDTTICSTALPFTWNGHVFESAGSVTDTLRTMHNSDSLVTYTLTVDEVDAAIGNVSHVVCYGDATGAAAATVTGGQDPMAYQWKDDGGNSVSTTTQIHDVMAGFYSFSVTDHLGCIASDTLTIRNLHEEIMPSTIAADQSVCEGDTLSRFTGSPASGGDEGVYQWQISSDGDVWATAPGISNQQNYTYPGIPQVSSFQLRRAWITASCGRAYSDTVEVEVWPAYHDTLSVTMCQGDTYQENGFEVDETMTANPGTFTLEQRLTTGHCDSVIILQYTVNQKYESTIEEEICEGKDYAAHGFVIPAEETVDVETLTRTLTLASVQGCDSLVQLHLTVVDTALQIVSLTPDFCEDMSAELVVVTELADYQWNTGETMSQITVTMPGVYSVTASQGNCRVQARYTVEPCEFKLLLPNAITPTRGDGLNDYFSIPETMQHIIGDFEITFYNRWGEIVFYSTDKSFRWNGEVNGTIYPNNVYSYIVRCTDVNGKQYTFKGTLTVL